MSSVKLDMSGFKELKNKLDTKKKVRVGILGADNSRDGEPFGNAEIGLVQEMGSTTKNIPPRSFIRMPLEKNAKQLASVFNTNIIRNAIENGDIDTALELLGIKAEAIIQEAFETQGFGQWAANAPSTASQKGSSSPLIDTGELRKSISSEVVDG